MEKVFIDVTEFQQKILDYILSEEAKEHIKVCDTKDENEFYQGFIHGMCWASIMTCQCNHYELKEREDGINN